MQVYYNNISILKRAKDNVAHIIVRHISWICEEEFDATEAQPISFIESDSFAFMKLQQNIDNYGFEFKTAQQTAPLIMSMNGQNVLLLEISNGIVKLISGNVNSKLEIFSDVLVSDGHWHSLNVKESASTLEVSEYICFLYHYTIVLLFLQLSIDNITYYKNHNLTHNGKLKNWYFGGVPIEVRKKIRIIQATNVEYALKGCMQNLYLNGLNKGFPDFRITRNVKTDCMWQFPCLEKQPCILSGKCIQKYTSKFSCKCDQLYCIRADFRGPYSVSLFSKHFFMFLSLLMFIIL